MGLLNWLFGRPRRPGGLRRNRPQDSSVLSGKVLGLQLIRDYCHSRHSSTDATDGLLDTIIGKAIYLNRCPNPEEAKRAISAALEAPPSECWDEDLAALRAELKLKASQDTIQAEPDMMARLRAHGVVITTDS